MIPNYDYYLEETRVNDLAGRVAEQIKEADIKEIDFYIENKESWTPYIKTLKKGADAAQVTLNIREF